MKRVLRGMLLALASAVLVLLFYVAVVMGQDLADVNGAARETGAQALPAPLEQVIELNSEEEIIKAQSQRWSPTLKTATTLLLPNSL